MYPQKPKGFGLWCPECSEGATRARGIQRAVDPEYFHCLTILEHRNCNLSYKATTIFHLSIVSLQKS